MDRYGEGSVSESLGESGIADCKQRVKRHSQSQNYADQTSGVSHNTRHSLTITCTYDNAHVLRWLFVRKMMVVCLQVQNSCDESHIYCHQLISFKLDYRDHIIVIQLSATMIAEGISLSWPPKLCSHQWPLV